MTSLLKLATTIANLLDNQFRIGPLRFGIDAILDLLPFSGDVAIFFLSCSLIFIGARMGLPRPKLLEMCGTLIFSFLIGIVPFLGDFAYLAIRPNMRNLRVLEEFYALQQGSHLSESM